MKFLGFCDTKNNKRPVLILGCFILIFSHYDVASQQLIPHSSQQFFEVKNQVSLSELGLRNNEETSYTFKVFLKVNSVWHSDSEQLLEVFFGEPTVSAPGKTNAKVTSLDITKIPDRPFYISIVDNKPHKVIAHTSKDQSLLNLERGIASLLMLQYNEGPTNEVDISGQCKSVYHIKSSTRIEKTKSDCSHWDLKVHYRNEKPLGTVQNSKELVKYELSADGTLLLAESTETHVISLASKPDVGNSIVSEFVLKHLATGEDEVKQLDFKTLDEAIKSLLDWYRVFDIEADVDGVLSEIKDTTLRQQISRYADNLTDEFIGKQEMALLFADLLPVARITKKDDFVYILNTRKKLQPQLVDLLGAVQTFEAFEAIKEVFDFHDNDHFDLLEKYLQALAVGTHPERAILEDLLELLKDKEKPIKNIKLHDSVLQTLASLTRQSGLDPNDKLLIDVREFILSKLNDCKDVPCMTLNIRALQNLQDITTIPKLITLALEEEAKISVAAMQALQSFPASQFGETQRKQFASIFYQLQNKYDSSARTIALEILFAMRPSKEQLGDLLDYLSSNDRQFEMKTYVIQKVRMLAEKCPRFKALLLECLAERPEVNNYHIIGQKGLTTVLSRQLSSAPSFNESLLSIQEINQGILKRGSVELILSAGREETSTFKLGIYTSGLSSFVGDDSESSDDEIEDDGPATAGMEISVQGVLLRPLIFFTGQSELMGHVWSGTASELTPAFQATTLAQDHEHYIILSSGATIYVRVLGAKSVDLNGKVSLSIWNRNAQTEINQNSGNAVVGHIVAGFTYARVESNFTVINEPKISLQADIDFYSGIKLCMQLQRPEMTLNHTSTRSVFLTSDKNYSKTVRSSINHKSPGRTLALNQKNNEMCNMIFG